MASSTSSILRVRLMAAGENVDTWGDNTNTNLELLEDAIAGHVSISVSAASTQVTATNWATDNQRYGAITFSGDVGATASVTFPTTQKFWFIRNNYTGTEGIKVKVSAGTGVTLTPDKWHFALADGSTTLQVIPLNVTTSISATSIPLVRTSTGVSASTAIGPAADPATGLIFPTLAVEAIVSGVQQGGWNELGLFTNRKGVTLGNISNKTRVISTSVSGENYQGILINADFELSTLDETGLQGVFMGMRDNTFVVVRCSATTGIPNFNEDSFAVSVEPLNSSTGTYGRWVVGTPVTLGVSTFSTGAIVSVNHGVGGAPDMTKIVYICSVSDPVAPGYGPGDRVLFVGERNTSGTTNGFVITGADATKAFIAGKTGGDIPSKTNGLMTGNTVVTPGAWNVEFTFYRFVT